MNIAIFNRLFDHYSYCYCNSSEHYCQCFAVDNLKIHPIHTRRHLCTSVHTHTHLHTPSHTHTHTCIPVHTHAYRSTPIPMLTHAYPCTPTHTCIYQLIPAHTHSHTRPHPTHTHALNLINHMKLLVNRVNGKMAED